MTGASRVRAGPGSKVPDAGGRWTLMGGGFEFLLSVGVGTITGAMIPVARLVTHATVTVGIDESIEQVYALMIRLGQRFLPVSQGGRVTAVLDREQLAKRLAVAGSRRRQLFVRDVLHPGMACLPASAPIEAAAKLMQTTGSSAVPVLDESHHLVGLITAKDIADALA
jgi:CBS domain-containing protein